MKSYVMQDATIDVRKCNLHSYLDFIIMMVPVPTSHFFLNKHMDSKQILAVPLNKYVACFVYKYTYHTYFI